MPPVHRTGADRDHRRAVTAWLARRLTMAGMRPINNVVDASNYVMLELGQPTHPYDLARLPGAGLRVRRARPGEVLETLDGIARTLGVPGRGLGDTGEDCLICDAEGTPVGIGGIMGGASSEIGHGTTSVLLETAYFTPMAIARTSKRLALRTEASARFERGCDPWGLERAADRFCELLRMSDRGATVAPGLLDVAARSRARCTWPSPWPGSTASWAPTSTPTGWPTWWGRWASAARPTAAPSWR